MTVGNFGAQSLGHATELLATVSNFGVQSLGQCRSLLTNETPKLVFDTGQPDVDRVIELTELLGHAKHRAAAAQNAYGSASKAAPSEKPVGLLSLHEHRFVRHRRGRLAGFAKPLCRFASIRQEIGHRRRAPGKNVNGFRHQVIAPKGTPTRI
jgi:hypothetical protein